MFDIFNFKILGEYSGFFPFSEMQLKEAFNSAFYVHNVSNVSIIFTTSEHIQQMNSEYRSNDTVTDVLSFELDEQNLLGEIYICPEYVYTTRGELGFKEEILRLMVHGMLHLLGMDHDGHFDESKPVKEEMFVKQEEILQNVLKNI